jgi:DHA3 family macrolide efflux protein-like MFS transporter
MKEHWNKNIILFLASQTISLFGSSLVQYAIMWYITLTTQSGVMMTISIICGFVPTFFLAPFAGVWADRYNRKMLIILSDSMIAIATLILAIVFLMGYDSLWLLFLMSSIRALGSAVQTPTVGAFIPQIVPEDKLTKINGINASIQAMIMLLSPMLSGWLLSITSIEIIFFIDVITATIAVLTLLLLLKVQAHAKALKEQELSYLSDMLIGFKYIKDHIFIRKFFIHLGLFNFFVVPAAFLTPLQVTRSFGNDVWRLTAIEVVFSIGMMLGGGVMAYWGGFNNRIKTMALSGVIMGSCTFGLGVAPNFWGFLFFMSIFGIVMPMFNTPATVLLQEKVKPDLLGRVFGVLAMITSSMLPMGMLLFGPISDFIKIENLLIVTGVLIFIQGIFLLKNKILKEESLM